MAKKIFNKQNGIDMPTLLLQNRNLTTFSSAANGSSNTETGINLNATIWFSYNKNKRANKPNGSSALLQQLFNNMIQNEKMILSV